MNRKDFSSHYFESKRFRYPLFTTKVAISRSRSGKSAGDRENQLEIGKISWGSGKSAGVFPGLCAVTRSLANSAADTVMHVISWLK